MFRPRTEIPSQLQDIIVICSHQEHVTIIGGDRLTTTFLPPLIFMHIPLGFLAPLASTVSQLVLYGVTGD